MIESVDNGIQLFITALCTGIAAYGWYKDRSREWILLGLFSGVYFLGDLYWQLFLTFYHETPVFSDVPYFSWYASYIFLLLLLTMQEKGAVIKGIKKYWPVHIFTAGLCVFFMQYGSYLNNLVCAFLMSLLISASLRGLFGETAAGTGQSRRPVYASVLLFCVFEYGMWISSCFVSGDSITNPYYWFDVLLSVDCLLITFATGKAVAHGLY